MNEDGSEEVAEDVLQRRKLAAQLQEKLHHDQQQLVNKEKQNELLKTKLSLIKSRSKAKRESVERESRHHALLKDVTDAASKIVEENSVERKQIHNKSNKGKINVLREQLEQNRLRFERHGQQLTEDARSMEAVVEQLRHKLEDNDVTLQQLQAGQLCPSISSTNVPANDSVDLHSRLADKEAQVSQLLDQNSYLQYTILELQENLKEKDCVIEARTRAITLLSEDMSKKWRTNVDMLEETRQQMHVMQENFISIEAGLNKEIEQLHQQLEVKAKKLLQVELTLKQTESARFDLATRNADLQRKIVDLQDHSQGEPELKEAQMQIEELSKALSDANRQALRLKEEHKAKIKTLNKQIDSLRKESGATEELARLKNVIADLEAEKAKQAQDLLDFREKIVELQSLKDAHEATPTKLDDQATIMELKQVIADMNLKLHDRSNEIELLQEELSHVAINSGKDQAFIDDLKCELADARNKLKEWEIRYENLVIEFKDQQKSFESVPHSNSVDLLNDQNQEISCQENLQNSQTLQSQLENKELEIKNLREKLHALEASLSSRVEHLENSFYSKHQQIQDLEFSIKTNLQKLQSNDLVSERTISVISGDIYNSRTLDEDRESHIIALSNKIEYLQKELKDFESLKTRFSDVCHKLAQFEERKDSFISSSSESNSGCDLCKDLENMKTKLVETEGKLELKQEECNRLEAKLKSLDEKLKKVAVNLKVKTINNKDLEERVSKLEKLIESNEKQIQELFSEKLEISEKWQTEISEKHAFITQAVADLARKDQAIKLLEDDLSSKTQTISQMTQKLNDLEEQLDDLKAALEKERKVAEESSESARNQASLSEQISYLQTEMAHLQDHLSNETEEKHAVVAKLESFTKNVKLKLAKEKKVRSDMQDKQVELENLLDEKSRIIAEIKEKYEQDILSLQKEIAALRVQEQEEVKASQYENIESDTMVSLPSNITDLEEFSQLFSLENIQNEVENLCDTHSDKSHVEILLILEEEKKKTLDQLQSRFETIHNQIVSRMHQAPDFNRECKLLSELQNLVIKVSNRCTVLESKTTKFIIDFENNMKMKFMAAQQEIQTQEILNSELKELLNQNQSERKTLEEKLKIIYEEKTDLEKVLNIEVQKSSNSEKEVEQSQGKIGELTDYVRTLERGLQEKEMAFESLQMVLKEKDSLLMSLQGLIQERELEIQNMYIQIQSNESSISTLQLDSQSKDAETKNLENEILGKNSMIHDLQAEIQEKAATIDSLLLQVQELPNLRSQLLELRQQNHLLEEDAKELRKAQQLLSECQLENKEHCDNLHKTEQLLKESVAKCTEQTNQLTEVSQKAANLEIQLQDASQKIIELDNQLSFNSQEYYNHYSNWNSEKEECQRSIHDLTERLTQAENQVTVDCLDSNFDQNKISSNEVLQQTLTEQISSNEVLQQKLAEKTAEVETYQQRLIQLQMGLSDSEPVVSRIVDASDSPFELIELRNKVKQLQEALDSHAEKPNVFVDSFNTASSLFETSEVSHLNNQLNNLSKELNLLLEEKQQWEIERKKSDENTSNLIQRLETLASEKEKAEADLLCLSDLKAQVAVLSSELNIAKSNVTEVCDLQSKAKKQLIEMKELQRQLECVQIDKVTAEEKCESLSEQLSKPKVQLKASESNATEDRPSIPQTLDTHVLTLQTSDTDLYDKCKKGSFIHGTMDESLMEHNITQLESELRGMVMSQRESSANQKENKDEWDWGEKEEKSDESKEKVLKTSLASGTSKVLTSTDELLIVSLKTKLQELERERDVALSEVTKLQDEVKKLSHSCTSETLTPPVTDTSLSIEQTWGEEDSWGWSVEKAKLEEQHQKLQKEEAAVLVDELQVKLKALESEREILENDKRKLSEDLKASQLRAAKLTRKFKELKAKYDELADKQKSIESQYDGLDQAIEEERLKQLQCLEKQLKDMQADLITVQTDRDRLQKQLEVFSSANEQMLHIKERQDVELEVWQKRNKDLTNQVQILERKIQELEEAKRDQEVSPMVQNVESQIHSNSSDTLNSVAVGQLIKENHTWNVSYETLMQEYQKLRAQHLSETEQRAQIDTLVAHQKDIIDRLEHEKSYLQDVYDSLKMDLEDANAQITSKLEDQNQITILTEKNADLLQKLTDSENKLSENMVEISCLREEVKLLKHKANVCNTIESSSNQNISQSPILQWSNVVLETPNEQEYPDVFEEIAANSQSSNKPLESEMNFIENQQNTHLEFKQDEVLEVARKAILELQLKLNSLLASFGSVISESGETSSQDQVVQLVVAHVTTMEEKLKNLMESLGVSEDPRRKLVKDDMLRNNTLHDDRRSPVTDQSQLQGSISSPTGFSSSESPPPVSFISEVAQHAEKGIVKELDLALYRLHQRDVRCDELTLELTRLLEERDALQLRLSNAIRTNEELREKFHHVTTGSQGDTSHLLPTPVLSSGAGDVPALEHMVSPVPQSPDKSFSMEEDKTGLQKKLAEIHEVHYGRDKWLREDQELRHQQQMQLLYSSQSTMGSPWIEVPNAEQGITVDPSDSNPSTSDANETSSSEAQGSFFGWLWG